ncbi:MAG: DUF4139 domain-containing protein [Niastella sp.]|nr:DUF4139 domain-containing protein [Niastella sp.]
MKKYFITFLPLTLLLLSFAPADEKVTTTSTLNSVTVYRAGAEMNHTANAYLKQGNTELKIDGISSYPDLNSIQVKCPASVTILSLEYGNDYLKEEDNSSVKRLKDSLTIIADEIKKIDVMITSQNELLDVLKTNKEVKGSQAGLSVAELAKLMDYYELKSIEIRNRLLLHNSKKNKLQNTQSRLSQQINEEQKKNTKTGGTLTLQLYVAAAGNSKFDVSYITRNAYWTPYYDVKAADIKSPLQFIYKAKISQTTGIDWKKVKLSLSTSTPSSFGNAPLLKTWFLSYIDTYGAINKSLNKINTIPGIAGASSELSEVVVTAYGNRRDGKIEDAIYIVNGNLMSKSEFSKFTPQAIKSTEVLSPSDAVALYGSRAAGGAVIVNLKDGLDDYVSVSESTLDITYDIDIPYDVPTNGKPQIATLKETSVPALYKYYTVPKLDKEVYLLAEIPNWQTLNLLPGEANIIFEGTYIGKSFIDPASTSDTLNFTLGTDKRVIIKREKLVDFSSIKFLGSNKLQTLAFDITVKNNKKEAIQIIVKDQYPISSNKEIEVDLLENSAGAVNEEIGVVTWILNIEPGQSKKVRISYSAKYPKNKTINFN